MQEKSLVWQRHSVSQAKRSALKAHKPVVLWFMGLSGAGKSTLANAVEEQLNRLACHTYLLDGDNIRHGLNKDLDFSPEARQENVRRVGELVRLFADAGLIVLSAFISPFREGRQKIRELLSEGQFIEIYVSTPLTVCEQRDPKGLYQKARSGELEYFTGFSSPYEQPEAPELSLDCSLLSIEEAVQKVIALLRDCEVII